MLKIKPSMMRHTGTIQKKTRIQNSEGIESTAWTNQHIKIPMGIYPISGKEFIAGGKLGSDTTVRIEFYKLSPFNASMRIVANGNNYDITGILPDLTNNVYINAMARVGISDG